MAKTFKYEELAPEYQKLWDTMKVIRDAKQLDVMATKVKQHKSKYEEVQKETGVPWQLVAVIHIREAGLQDVGVFKGVLHNGQRIVGTGKKTTIVPAGRGPFKTWKEAAIDALKLKGFDKIKEWPVSRMLWALEPYNGYGYRYRGLPSPYLWASTNHQKPGKFVRDHVFDATVVDTQMGAAAMLKFLGVGEKLSAPVAPIAIPAGAAVVVGAEVYKPGFWQQAATIMTEHVIPIAILAGVCLVLYITYKKLSKNNA